MSWLYLAIAIVSEVIATSALKATEGFTHWVPSVVVVIGYTAAFYFLSLTLRSIPLGIAYAVWSGAGHFAKMVHNGIEYAIMQAYAEGWELLEKVDLVDNETEVFRSWREGTVIRSWLLDLLVQALDADPGLAAIGGYADDSGEGRWTVEAGIENAVPTPAITAALYARFVSRQEDSPAMKAIAAMRNQFGGHALHSVDQTLRSPESDSRSK